MPGQDQLQPKTRVTDQPLHKEVYTTGKSPVDAEYEVQLIRASRHRAPPSEPRVRDIDSPLPVQAPLVAFSRDHKLNAYPFAAGLTQLMLKVEGGCRGSIGGSSGISGSSEAAVVMLVVEVVLVGVVDWCACR